MPYQLAQDTHVQVHIFNLTGCLIRTLNLGYQMAGYYLEKLRAAHWDGRNDFGEQMASGVYFYQLIAADDTAMRKLVILK